MKAVQKKIVVMPYYASVLPLSLNAAGAKLLLVWKFEVDVAKIESPVVVMSTPKNLYWIKYK